MKRCPKCKQVKSYDEFYKRKDMKDGYSCWCKKCTNESCKNWNKKFPNKHRERCEKYRKNHPEQNKTSELKHRFSKYGITIEDYNRMVENQNGVCAICGNSSKRMLDVDHDHLTNRNRGLLCGNCNKGIGLFKDDINILQKAIKYLKEKDV
jgi:hypothetical protein